MKELSLHILDLVQNSVHAKADEICIEILERSKEDSYQICIRDNGSGMDAETLKNILNPFFTTKRKKTGLGIPLLTQHAELTGGEVTIDSEVGKGTGVIAKFVRSSIDRQPLGDMAGTMTGLIRSYPGINFEYIHVIDEKKFTFSTREITEELDGVPLQSAEVIGFIKELIVGNLTEMGVA